MLTPKAEKVVKIRLKGGEGKAGVFSRDLGWWKNAAFYTTKILKIPPPTIHSDTDRYVHTLSWGSGTPGNHDQHCSWSVAGNFQSCWIAIEGTQTEGHSLHQKWWRKYTDYCLLSKQRPVRMMQWAMDCVRITTKLWEISWRKLHQRSPRIGTDI